MFWLFTTCGRLARRFPRGMRAATAALGSTAMVLVLSGTLPAASRRPITHADVWLMKQLGAPAPSPDGKWVVVPVTEPAYDEKNQVSDLWIVPADGTAAPRRLTFSKGAETGVTWASDSRRIAFSARREGDEAAQIYVLDITGGEAVRVTSLSTGAANPKWRPDGGAIAFTSMVYPGAADDAANRKIAAERAARKYKARVFDGFPIRRWDHWLDDRRQHLFVQELTEGSSPRDLLAATSLAAQAGFDGAPGSTASELQYTWSPDGRWLVFAATVNRHMAAYADVVTHLYQVPASGGEPKQLTSGEVSYTKPAFRPDGKALYALSQQEGRQVYYLHRLAMFTWPSVGDPRLVTGSSDRNVGAFAFTPDSGAIYFLAEDAGLEKVYTLPAAGGEVSEAFPVKLGCYTHLAIPPKAPRVVLVANWESATTPAEVVRIENGSPRRLSSFNAARAAEIDWQPLRHFWFEGRAGRRIHSMLALPPAFDEKKKYPLVVVMHGGPASMWRDQFITRWNYHLLAAPGYVVLLTNYTGSTGFGEKFAQAIQFDPLAGPAADINAAADEAIRRYPFIDGTRQAAAGASYGGHLANWMQATTTRYKCLVSHAGLINLESQWGTSDTIYHREVNAGGPFWEGGKVWSEQNPVRKAASFRTPILVTVGERDYRVPLNQSIENWSVLQRMRVPSRLIVFDDANHWISKGEDSRFWYQEVHNWMRKYL